MYLEKLPGNPDRVGLVLAQVRVVGVGSEALVVAKAVVEVKHGLLD